MAVVICIWINTGNIGFDGFSADGPAVIYPLGGLSLFGTAPPIG
jgi:hypothetical protein